MVQKTGQGTIENGVGESNPAAAKQLLPERSIRSLHHWRKLLLGERMATGLVDLQSKEPWPAPPSKVVLDRWAEGSYLLQQIRE